MSNKTIALPAGDERVLELLEAEFLRRPSGWRSPSELNLAETLGPAVGHSYDELPRATRHTMLKCPHKNTCCD